MYIFTNLKKEHYLVYNMDESPLLYSVFLLAVALLSNSNIALSSLPTGNTTLAYIDIAKMLCAQLVRLGQFIVLVRTARNY